VKNPDFLPKIVPDSSNILIMVKRSYAMIKSKQLTNLSDDLLWGVAAIADHIGRERRGAYYLISKGVIPTKKLGAKTICARRSEIDRALTQLGGDHQRT
jgi:hypothetical protein